MPLPMYDNKKNNISSVSGSPIIQNVKSPITIAVAAGKGGVGKSTVAVHLALALKNSGYKVGLMDTDIYGPSIRQMLPEDRAPQQKGDLIYPAMCQGIKMISMAYFRDGNQSAAVRAPIANGIVTQFIQKVQWGGIDYLIIDFPPGTGDIQLTLSQQAKLSGAVMVTTPQEISIMDVRKAMHLFGQVKVPVIGVVENMSGLRVGPNLEVIYPFGKGGGERLARESGVPFLGRVLIDSELSGRLDIGRNAFEEPQTISADVFKTIADNVMEQIKDLKGGDSIKNITLKDPQTFIIEWMDGKVIEHRFSDLQRRCPCAGCTDEKTGKSLVTESMVNPNVEARQIHSVGRYGIRIEYTSGCSTGIYPYSMLSQRCGALVGAIGEGVTGVGVTGETKAGAGATSVGVTGETKADAGTTGEGVTGQTKAGETKAGAGQV